jgi:hypothetical protein
MAKRKYMADVFVSYPTANYEAVAPIIEAISQAGLSVRHREDLISPVASRPEPPSPADCELVIWSKEAAKSKFLAEEVRHALKAWSSNRLVLAALDNSPLPVGLRDLQYTLIRGPSDIGKLVRRVRINSKKKPRSKQKIDAKINSEAIDVEIKFAALRIFGFRLSVVKIVATTFLFLAVISFLYLATSVVPFVPSSLVILIIGVIFGAVVAVMAGLPRTLWKGAIVESGSVNSKFMTSDAPSVFISYSRNDSQVVDKLAKQIEELGYQVWIDRNSRTVGRYASPIVQAIRTSRLVALMCSHNAFASDHVIREVYVAGEYKKPFIAFELDSAMLPDEILYFLTGFPRVPVGKIDPDILRSTIAKFLG